MPLAPQELEAAALTLPRCDRARLAQRLLESLDEDSEVEQAWAAEVERRLDEHDRGQVQAIPGEEVFAKARARLRG
ncbi:MAG: addiction module protein [Thermodesulfobacteriota bacterium]